MASARYSEVCQAASADADTACLDDFKLDVTCLATDESGCAASFKTTSMDSLMKGGADASDAVLAGLADGDRAAASERWRERREERRARLTKQRAKFGSQAHAIFCGVLCSSDCRLHGDRRSMFQ